MSAIADQIAATLGVVAVQVDDCIVTVGHTYSDEAGAHSQTFQAMRSSLSGDQQVRLLGSLQNETYRLTVNLVEERGDGATLAVLPKPGDKVTVTRGDDAATTHIILSREVDLTESVMTLLVGSKNG